MKALTDKIIQELEFKRENQSCGRGQVYKEGFESGLTEAKLLIQEFEKQAEFEEIARIMMKHLGQGEKYHPHHSVIITNTNAELVEGLESTGKVMDYISD